MGCDKSRGRRGSGLKWCQTPPHSPALNPQALTVPYPARATDFSSPVLFTHFRSGSIVSAKQFRGRAAEKASWTWRSLGRFLC